MALKSVCFFLFVLHGAFSEVPLLHPCSKDDIACLSESARNFLEKTCAGIKDYDIKPIDPWFSLEIKLPVVDDLSVVLKNVSVIGLKLMKINNFHLDPEKRSVVLGMKDNAEFSADIEVEKAGQKTSGTVSGQQYRMVTARYSYVLIPDKKGVDYFRVGPEALTCELEGKPNINVNEEVANLLWGDAATAEESKKKLICTIIERAYGDVMHNLRASANIYPKTAYFTDLK